MFPVACKFKSQVCFSFCSFLPSLIFVLLSGLPAPTCPWIHDDWAGQPICQSRVPSSRARVIRFFSFLETSAMPTRRLPRRAKALRRRAPLTIRCPRSSRRPKPAHCRPAPGFDSLTWTGHWSNRQRGRFSHPTGKNRGENPGCPRDTDGGRPATWQPGHQS